MRHVKRGKVINAHGDLEVFLGSVIRWDENACIVDQDVQRRSAVKELVRKVLDRAAMHKLHLVNSCDVSNRKGQPGDHSAACI